MGKDEFLTVNSASTTTAIEPGAICTWVSGLATNAYMATAGENVTTPIAGVVVKGCDTTASATIKKITVQTAGLAKMTVTTTGGATTCGAYMILSATTASLATVIATYGTTFAGYGVRGDLLGVVVEAATTTGTSAIVDLRIQ